MVKLSFNSENTFCISLHNHKDRWQIMLDRFARLKMEVTRFQASTEENELDGTFSNSLNSLQKCCANSHIRLWKQILRSDSEYALILEDDACFDKGWVQKLDTIVVDENWDAIFLNCSEPIEPRDTWIVTHEQYLTGGYIISKKGVRRILEMFDDCYYSSDWMTSRLQCDNQCYSYFPWLVIQDGGESTIGSDVTADHAKVVRLLDEICYSMDNYII